MLSRIIENPNTYCLCVLYVPNLDNLENLMKIVVQTNKIPYFCQP